MKESDFLKLAKQEITHIQDTLESSPLEDIYDIDMIGDILYIKLPDSREYVINKHFIALELWLSSPISGGYHFAFDQAQGRWIDSKQNEIRALLSKELGVVI